MRQDSQGGILFSSSLPTSKLREKVKLVILNTYFLIGKDLLELLICLGLHVNVHVSLVGEPKYRNEVSHQ